MAHGERAQALANNRDREYWSRRPGGKYMRWGWFGKLLTHRAERREARRVEREAAAAVVEE